MLVVSGLIGGIFDFTFSAFGWWSEVVSSRMIHYGEVLANRVKMVMKIDVSAMVFGLGYIVGLKGTAIIAAGSFLSWFVLVPLVYEVGHSLTIPLGATATKLIADMSAEEIFRNYVRQIGIGGIAMAGIIGIIRSSKIIAGAFSLAYKEIFHAKTARAETTVRWQTDIKMLFFRSGPHPANGAAYFCFLLRRRGLQFHACGRRPVDRNDRFIPLYHCCRKCYGHHRHKPCLRE